MIRTVRVRSGEAACAGEGKSRREIHLSTDETSGALDGGKVIAAR